ncbi:MAG: bifunctional oligoribonuclease/PAP phosphatase NrnA [Campylobacterales bacterium]
MELKPSQFLEVWQEILKGKKITIVPHLNPDGDAIGSGLGLYWALKKLGKNVKLYSKTQPLPYFLDFLPGFQKFTGKYDPSSDLVITVDCGDFERTGLPEKPKRLINIDHHQTNPDFGDLNLVDRGGPATSLVVYYLFKFNQVEFPPESATTLYTGILTDTGNFQYNVNSELFQVVAKLVEGGADPVWIAQMLYQRDRLSRLRLLAKIYNNIQLCCNGLVAHSFVTLEMYQETGGNRDDTEGVPAQLRNIAPVEIGVFFREEENGGVKVSLRSKSTADVSRIAQKLGGGGHQRAAGATLPVESIEEAREQVIPLIKEELKQVGMLQNS